MGLGCRGGDTASGASTPVPGSKAAPIAVRAASVLGHDEPVTLQATGSFEAEDASDVAPEASGRVVETPVDVGAFVKAGSVLVRLQGIDAGLRLEEARAAASRAESNLKLVEGQNVLAQTTAERYTRLLASGDVSRTVADQARSEAETSQQNVATSHASLAEARAQLALAEKAVADVVVTAPFAGYISARRVSLGEYVQPSTPVVTLLKTDPLRLLLTLPGVQSGQVATGQRVGALVDAYPGRSFEGTIRAVNPAIDPQSRTYQAEARVPNPSNLLKPGMFVVASIDQGRTTRALFVPRAGVIEDVNTNSYRVFVIDENNRARLRVVQLAPQQMGDRVRIVSGISEGQRVATTNLAQLYDTALVTIEGGAAVPASTSSR
jgi:RND family efflux transporter MFP subunit